MARIFIGTFLDAVQQNKLSNLLAGNGALESYWPQKIRIVKPSKLHLTWVFLGDQHNEIIPEIQNVLSGILQKKKSMSLSYDKGEFWPNSKKAHLFVLTPNLVPKEIDEFGLELRDAFGKYLIKRENNAFHPHITLMRFPEQKKDELVVPDWLRLNQLLPLHHIIDKVELIESKTAQDGYVILKSFKLE